MKKVLHISISLAVIFLLDTSVLLALHGEGGPIDNPLKQNVSSLTELLVLIINNIIIPVGAVIAVMAFIYVGFLFVMAQGNSTKLEDAKKMFFGVIIGTLLLLGAGAIARAIEATILQITNVQ